jgi:dTDP-4-dehydrorhamnose 3,5-epimerase
MTPPLIIDYSFKIKGLKHYEYSYFSDGRGINAEGWRTEYEKLLTWPVESASVSKKDVLRGFHGDADNHKLIQCVYGQIQFFVIDTRKDSPTFGNIAEFYLNALKDHILVPAGCVNAHLCLSDYCAFTYKLSQGYVNPEKQIHVKWNDPTYNIPWRNKEPILSKRDA